MTELAVPTTVARVQRPVPMLVAAGATTGVAVVLAASWVWSTARGTVPIEFAGDESGRLLEAYEKATPSGLIDHLVDPGWWRSIHPPGDVAFRAFVNMALGFVVDDRAQLVQANQAIAAVLVVAGLAGMCVGLCRLGVVAGMVFVAFAAPSAAVIYVAHHALAESLAVGLVGVGTFLLLRDHHVAGGAFVGAAGLVRPEVALVFASLAVVPFTAHRIRPAITFASLAAGPALVHTVLLEFTGNSSYASVQLWSGRTLFDVAFGGAGPEVYWGLGGAPWVGLVIGAGLVACGFWVRLPLVTAGRLLLVCWVAWSLIFAWFAARGAIPTHTRTYVALHLLGALALGIAGHEVVGDRQRIATAVTAAAAVALLVAIPATATSRDEWRAAYPGDVATVNAFLADTDGGAILTDWLWWREFTVALYAIEPGGAVCNYARCPAETPAAPPLALTAGRTDVETERLTNAWTFLTSEDVQFIVMLDDREYERWRQWEATGNADVLSSFVRPLLGRDGDCYTTVAGLPATTFCPALDHGRFLVLERV